MSDTSRHRNAKVALTLLLTVDACHSPYHTPSTSQAQRADTQALHLASCLEHYVAPFIKAKSRQDNFSWAPIIGSTNQEDLQCGSCCSALDLAKVVNRHL